jgi:outer membrane beta-barrel protein
MAVSNRTMRYEVLAIALLALLAAATPATAADILAAQTAPAAPAQPANEQVIEPSVVRRDVRLPKIPSKDFIVGAFAGTYATENFGSSAVYGLRLGYHVTEDLFVEGAYAQTEVSDANFRQVLPGGIFPERTETLSYYNLSAGYNVLPGEVFIGRNWAKASALYLMAGIGSTKFLEQRKLTLNYGIGLRMFMKDWASLQVDMKDHVYSLDLLGRRQSTHNLELSAGLTFYF